ncbi:hypothetical protein BDN70DRAFT_929427 [Pholiota conissans]|uniref:F-box domain-containing protein n=1 Tax=Pholiota conissans TaxID=109636 RepID=A0A9P5Z948_9AGAR|nr:hypothetical protein BDN70DRAFT_929427 [Pholiota conissans]
MKTRLADASFGVTRSMYNHSTLRSPVPYLLTSNVAPLENEIISINRAIQEAEAVLFENDSGRILLHNEDICEYVLFIQQHHSILSVIRNIPFDILQEIFRIIVVGQPDSQIKKSRWLVTSISQSWRVAAVTHPMLWSVIPPVKLHYWNTQNPCNQIDCLAQTLRRSGNAPLVVTIIGNHDVKSIRRHSIPSHYGLTAADKSKPLFDAFNLLLAHHERWQSLSVSLPLDIVRILPIFSGCLPLLETLSLNISPSLNYHGSPNAPAPFIDQNFRKARQLLRLEVNGLPIPDIRGFALVYYKQMDISTLEPLKRIATYSSLESLSIGGRTLDLNNFSITLPYLKRLEFLVESSERSEAVRCFDKLILPALEKVVVSFPPQFLGVVPSLIRMISNGDMLSKLHTMQLTFGNIEAGELVTLLHHTPVLINLDLTCPPALDIEALVSTTSFGTLAVAPLLQSCKFNINFAAASGLGVLDTRTRDALNSLARARCDGDQASSMMLSLYSTPISVPITIKKSAIPWSQSMRAHMENWPQTTITRQLIGLNAFITELCWPSKLAECNREVEMKDLRLGAACIIRDEIETPEDIIVSVLPVTFGLLR